jgi:anti-sigma factor RsiW
MQCNKFMTCIERYHDKVLSGKKQSACDEHLKACPRCSRAVAEMVKMKFLFTQTSVPVAPADLTADIMKSVRQSATGVKNRNGALFTQWWKEAAFSARLALALTLFIIIAASFLASRDLWTGPASRGYPEYSEFDSFSEIQKGSLETAYFQLLEASSPKEVR